MNLSVLNYILTISEEKNITKAANKLHISQSALSQSLHNLESELNCVLFNRETSPLSITPCGELFLDWAKRVINSHEQLLTKISDLTLNPGRTLRIGLSPQKSVKIFPDIIKTFYDLNPDCKIILEEHPSDVLLNMLEKNDIDLLFDVIHSDCVDITYIPIVEEKIYIAAPLTFKFHAVTGKRYPDIEMTEIMEKPFIMLSDKQYLGKIARNLFTLGNYLPNICMECRSADMALEMVSTGLGITVVPEFAVRNNVIPNIQIYNLRFPELKRTVGISYKKSGYLSQDSTVFIELIKKNLN